MTKFVPIVLILIGLALWRFPARSSFNRRNQYGVEMFESYGHMRRRRSFEGLIRFLGVILLLVGFGRFIVPDRFGFSHLYGPGSQVPATPAPTKHHRHEHTHE